MCTALVVGNMIGSGIFLLPSALAPLGWNAVLGWLITIAGGLSLAYVFGQLARRFPKAGGPYAYAEAAFGPGPAFVVAWSYWISLWVGNAAIATAMTSYLSVFAPVIGQTPGLHAAVTCGAIWALTGLACFGAHLAGRIQLVTTGLKLLPLVAVIGLGAALTLGDPAIALPPLDTSLLSIGAVASAATLTLWALLGLESATVPADKVKDPERTIPRATMLGAALTGVISLLACSFVSLLTPPEVAANSNAPFADFIAAEWGPTAGLAIAVFAAISCFGALNGWILLQGELPRAMAMGGVFPAWLKPVSTRGVPVRCYVTSSLFLTAVVALNYSKTMAQLFQVLILLATTASLVMYVVTGAAALKLSKDKALPASALLLSLALLTVIYSLWAIYGAGLEAALWGLALLAAGAPVYFFMKNNGLNR
jgi:basic amino acid/polyamine antiporter, APA family